MVLLGLNCEIKAVMASLGIERDSGLFDAAMNCLDALITTLHWIKNDEIRKKLKFDLEPAKYESWSGFRIIGTKFPIWHIAHEEITVWQTSQRLSYLAGKTAAKLSADEICLMTYRPEWKHTLTFADLTAVLREFNPNNRLVVVARKDSLANVPKDAEVRYVERFGMGGDSDLEAWKKIFYEFHNYH